MRNPDRIYKFCNELADIWHDYATDWRFGQLMCNVFGEMAAKGRDPFFPEEDEMIEYFKKFFKIENEKITLAEFEKKYCELCGTQRCEGPGTEWFDGCIHKEKLRLDK